MKTIKHLNIEYDSNNLFSLESKVFKLTKGNVELLVSLYNDIVNDFYDKIEKILNENKIDFTRNDVDHELFNTIRIDSFSNFCNTNKIEYVPNDTHTNEEFEINIMLGASVIFDFIYFHFDNNKKLRKDYHTIRYDREYETEEMKEIREYFEDVISFLSYKIELEYDIIKKEDIEDQPEPEPLDLSNSSIAEKIALLYESGIIDYLHKKDGKPHTVNSIASLLSGITGIDAKTIQSAINPFINTNSRSKGTPAESTLNKAKNKIIDLGFNS